MSSPGAIKYMECPLTTTVAADLKDLLQYPPAFFDATVLNMTSDQFVSVVSPGDIWTGPTISCVNLVLQGPQAQTLLYRKFTAGEAMLSGALNHTGEWCIQKNVEQRVWLRNVKDSSTAGRRISSGEIVHLIAWLTDDTFALIKNCEIVHETVAGVITTTLKIDKEFPKRHIITSYSVSPNGLWALLTGIRITNKHKVTGGFQLICMQDSCVMNSVANILSAEFMATDSEDQSATLVAAAHRETDGSVRFSVHSLPGWVQKFRVEVPCTPEQNGLNILNNNVIAIKINEKLQIAFVITMLGYVHLFDVHLGEYIGSRQISSKKVVAVVKNKATGGITVVDRDGKIHIATLDVERMVTFLSQKFGSQRAADFAVLNGCPVHPGLLVDYFLRILLLDQAQAMTFISSASLESLSGPEILRLLKACLSTGKRFLHTTIQLSHKVRLVAGIDALASMFEAAGYPEGLFAFLNGCGPRNLTGETFVKFVKISVEQKQFGALKNLVTRVKVQDSAALATCLSELDTPEVPLLAFIEPLCLRYKMIAFLVKYLLKFNLHDKIVALIVSADTDSNQVSEILRELRIAGTAL